MPTLKLTRDALRVAERVPMRMLRRHAAGHEFGDGSARSGGRAAVAMV